MALDALTSYSGQDVAIVGEWDGDTGTSAFVEHLCSHWRLRKVVQLPNWTDSAHDLTIWQRAEPGDAGTLQIPSWPCCADSGRS